MTNSETLKFKDCPYKEQTEQTLDRHECKITKLEDRTATLELKQNTTDVILTRLEIAVNKFTTAVYWAIGTAIIMPVLLAISKLVIK